MVPENHIVNVFFHAYTSFFVSVLEHTAYLQYMRVVPGL